MLLKVFYYGSVEVAQSQLDVPYLNVVVVLIVVPCFEMYLVRFADNEIFYILN